MRRARRANGSGQPAGIDAQASALLRKSTDFLASRPRISAETRNRLEVVLTSGQKIQFNHTARVSVQRPNRLRVEQGGDLVAQSFYYDAKSPTPLNPDEKYYATIAASGAGVVDPGRNPPGVVGNVSGVARRWVRF